MNKKQLLVAAVVSICITGLDRLFLHTGAIALLGVVVYLLAVGTWVGRFLLPKEQPTAQAFWGGTMVLSGILLLNTSIYYVYQMHPAISWGIFLLPLGVFLLRTQHNVQTKIFSARGGPASGWQSFPPEADQPRAGSLSFLSVLFLFCEGILFWMVYAARTVEAMPSPWQNLGPLFFALYTIATILLFFSKQKILIIPHLFLTYSIAAIMYPLGYGFDGFIHRAAETWIDTHGWIAPKQPFYIGQYSMVVWLHHLTGISIKLIDVFAVPLIASIALPASIIFMLRRAWQIPAQYASTLLWLVPAVPFLTFNLTTPHNIVLLATAVIVCAMICYWHEALPAIIPLLIALAAVATHPLVGAPILLFVIGSIGLHTYHFSKKIFILTLILTSLAIALAVPCMFATFLFLTHHGLPTLSNPFEKFYSFLELFKIPYYYRPHAPLRFEILYAWARMIVPLLGLAGYIGYTGQKQIDTSLSSKERAGVRSMIPAGIIGLWLGAFLLRSWIVFPNVAGAEQGDYPLRLLKTSVLFILPFSMYAVYAGWRKLEGRTARYGLPILFACLLTLSLYFSYPQRNPKVQFPGYNVTVHDFNAVKWIHDQEGNNLNYIVLSNPLPAVAALETYSFSIYHETSQGPLFYYSIPSGGPLYAYYLDMVYRGSKQETMQDAMKLANVSRAYFVLDDYWANATAIAENAKKIADSWQEFDGGRVRVFVYNRD